jgi:hypothetical protein
MCFAEGCASFAEMIVKDDGSLYGQNRQASQIPGSLFQADAPTLTRFSPTAAYCAIYEHVCFSILKLGPCIWRLLSLNKVTVKYYERFKNFCGMALYLRSKKDNLIVSKDSSWNPHEKFRSVN